MNLYQLNKKLDEAYCETARLRIAIMRAVGRDPFDIPPSDETLMDELRRLTSVPADRLSSPPQTDSDDTAAAEHHRWAVWSVKIRKEERAP